MKGAQKYYMGAGECLLVYQAKIVQIKNVDRRQETECLLEGPVYFVPFVNDSFDVI